MNRLGSRLNGSGQMNYFVTGGTGFIGYNLIEELLSKRKQATIYELVRKGSRKKLDRLKASLGRCGALAWCMVSIGSVHWDGT